VLSVPGEKEKTMAKYWINDEEKTKLISKYMVNDKHYGMWAIQIMDGKHEFHVMTAEGRVLGSKMCTLKGRPVYSLFDGENVDLVHVDPRLVLRIRCHLQGGMLDCQSFSFTSRSTVRTRGTFTVVAKKKPKHHQGGDGNLTAGSFWPCLFG
jgi:hypothetical protein